MKPLRRPRLAPAPHTPGRRMPDFGEIRENWHKGGTLHAATFAEWHRRGTYEDGLATCADWVAAIREKYPRNNIRYTSGDELLWYAHTLLTAINVGSADGAETWPDANMFEFAFIAAGQLGWLRPDGVMPGQNIVDPMVQMQAELNYLRRELEQMKEATNVKPTAG